MDLPTALVNLVREILSLGCEFVRQGGKHDWYRNPNAGVAQPIPCHREIHEMLARHVIQVLGASPVPRRAE